MSRFVLPAAILACSLTLSGCDKDTKIKDRDPGAEGSIEVVKTLDNADEAAGDQAVLDAMKGAGADLSKTTDIRWYVYFRDEAGAKAFADKAKGGGWKVEVSKGDQGDWLALSSKDGVPALKDIAAMRADLHKSAAGHDVVIDGWEAAIQQP